ncbi:MAG TPA: arsenate reductase (glutaredoxin) [Rhizobiales bacterium]|nr:arsenate reductase (glutaredoxin) [Hyphomicrobiales bacterium]
MDTTIFHNPRCSKSRQTLELLNENGVSPKIVKYLETPPSAGELKEILAMLGISPRELMRKGEAEYKEQGLADENLSDEELIMAMVKTPRLIERPIVIKGNKAALGRPPVSVLDIL